MNFKYLTITLSLLCIISGCSNRAIEQSKSETIDGFEIDSCELAQPFEPVSFFESNASRSFTGDLNNYWGTDTTKLDYKYVFENGKIVKCYFYYENGQIQEEYLIKCKSLHGTQKWYFEDGTLAQTMQFRFGFRQGLAKTFDEEGRLRVKGSFTCDTIYGHPEYFDEEGNPTEDNYFE